MRRRLAIVVALGASLWLAGSGVALADDGMEELFRESAEAEYQGRGIVMTVWGTETAAAIFTITRSSGMSMVTGAGRTLAVADGLAARNEGDAWYGFNVGSVAPWELSGPYEIRDTGEVDRLDRTARSLLVLEDGFPRVRLLIDAETSAPLVTQILDGSGRLFRTSFLTDFSVAPLPASPSSESPMPEMMDSMSVDLGTPSSRLPAEIGAYRRADVYAAPSEGVQAFYSDGLFSFSVFESRRSATPDRFKSATEFEVDGERYRRIVEPSRVWIQWHAPDHTYVLVGDLPPDHLDRVLPALPEPGDRALIVRFWRRLFG